MNLWKGKEKVVKNLQVESKHGNMDVDVWLVGDFYRDAPATAATTGQTDEQLQGRRAELDISSVHGAVTAKLVCLVSFVTMTYAKLAFSDRTRQPLALTRCVSSQSMAPCTSEFRTTSSGQSPCARRMGAYVSPTRLRRI